MKAHIRVIGIDDGPFTFSEDMVIFTAVLMRLPAYVEGIAIGKVRIDGSDSTERIAEIIGRKRWGSLAHAVLIDGAALGGFNIVDIERLSEIAGLPAITVTSDRPDMERIKEALKHHFNRWEERYRMLSEREIHEVVMEDGMVYISFSGIDLKGAKEIIRKSVVRGLVPEAIRMAHIVSRAVKEAENEALQGE